MSAEMEPRTLLDEEKTDSHTPALHKPSEQEGEGDSWADIIRFVLITAAVVFPIRWFIVQPFMVSGPSMEPTFMNSDYLIVDELSYRFTEPERGDVIVLKRPGEQKYLIKRIAGLPSETLILEGNTVTVYNSAYPDGFVWNQPFVSNHKEEQKTTVKLGSGEYFVLGDNRPLSFDSRGWGALGRESIVGRPLLRLYPFDKIALWPGEKTK